MRHIFGILLVTGIALASAPVSGAARDDISLFDQGRLALLSESRARGLLEAEAGASPRDLAAIHAVLTPPSRPISGRALLGDWQCRIMKLGGLSPAVVYSQFRCRVRQTRDGFYFEKLTGNERISGFVVPYEGGRVVLAGALTVNNERQLPYSGESRGVGAPTSSRDAVGIISGIGAGLARIEFPYPTIESTFDVIELKRFAPAPRQPAARRATPPAPAASRVVRPVPAATRATGPVPNRGGSAPGVAPTPSPAPRPTILTPPSEGVTIPLPPPSVAPTPPPPPPLDGDTEEDGSADSPPTDESKAPRPRIKVGSTAAPN